MIYQFIESYSQFENIVKSYIQSTLLTLHYTKFVLYYVLHFNETFSSRMFPEIFIRGKSALVLGNFRSEVSHACDEPTKEVFARICIKNLKYRDNTILTDVFVKRTHFVKSELVK